MNKFNMFLAGVCFINAVWCFSAGEVHLGVLNIGLAGLNFLVSK